MKFKYILLVYLFFIWTGTVFSQKKIKSLKSYKIEDVNSVKETLIWLSQVKNDTLERLIEKKYNARMRATKLDTTVFVFFYFDEKNFDIFLAKNKKMLKLFNILKPSTIKVWQQPEFDENRHVEFYDNNKKLILSLEGSDLKLNFKPSESTFLLSEINPNEFSSVYFKDSTKNVVTTKCYNTNTKQLSKDEELIYNKYDSLESEIIYDDDKIFFRRDYTYVGDNEKHVKYDYVHYKSHDILFHEVDDERYEHGCNEISYFYQNGLLNKKIVDRIDSYFLIEYKYNENRRLVVKKVNYQDSNDKLEKIWIAVNYFYNENNDLTQKIVTEFDNDGSEKKVIFQYAYEYW